MAGKFIFSFPFFQTFPFPTGTGKVFFLLHYHIVIIPLYPIIHYYYPSQGGGRGTLCVGEWAEGNDCVATGDDGDDDESIEDDDDDNDDW